MRGHTDGAIVVTGMNSGTHLQRWIFALLAAAFALYCDNASLGDSKIYYQVALWNLVLVSEFLIEIRRTLRRTRAASIALALFCLHCLLMYWIRNAFPFHSSLALVMCALLECVLFAIVYLRLCQSIDPKGPFGMTAAEKEARKKKRLRLS